MRKHIRFVYLCIAALIFMLALPQDIQAAKGKLNKKRITLTVDETFSLKVRGVKGERNWKSSDPEVAEVDSTGLVLAKQPGEAVITVKVKKWEKDCHVTVQAPLQNEPETPEPSSEPQPVQKPNAREDGEYLDPELYLVNTERKVLVTSAAAGLHWDGNTNIAQFADPEGNFAYACEEGDQVRVVICKNGNDSREVLLKKPHPLFGTVLCDAEGNFYLATGEKSPVRDENRESIFISKFDKDGNHIATVGETGGASLPNYHGVSYYTQEPFYHGNCEMALNGEFLTLHYARSMYNGGQSDSVFTINKNTMEKVKPGIVFQSQCFAERVIPFGNGFVYAGEGASDNRAFTATKVVPGNDEVNTADLFHFWIEFGHTSDMQCVENNFARMGGLAKVNDSRAALLGLSAMDMNENAKEQKMQLFIQIFEPDKKIGTPESYVTKGSRSGNSGKNGDEYAEDQGVFWLTGYDEKIRIENPQIVSDGNGRLVILFEKYLETKIEETNRIVSQYKGLFCIELDQDGKTLKAERCLGDRIHLNPYRMPVYADGKIYWAANKESQTGEKDERLFVCSLD